MMPPGQGHHGRNSPSFSAYAPSSNGISSPGTPLPQRSIPHNPSLSQRSQQLQQRHRLNQSTDDDQSRNIALVHWKTLDAFLREGNQEPPTNRTNAREKLTRLTKQQFRELSTDVYDELTRQKADTAGEPDTPPYLAYQQGFHPKRNQARQKLASLPQSRFRDLASDVYFEISRRFPEFNNTNDEFTQPQQQQQQQQQPLQPQQQQQQKSQQQQLLDPPTPISPAASSATNDVIVPNKSTFVEEDVSDQPPEFLNRQPSLSTQQSLNDSQVSKQMTNVSKWDDEQVEKIKSDYETKIMTYESRIEQLEQDLENEKLGSKSNLREIEKLKASERDLQSQLSDYGSQHQDEIRQLKQQLEQKTQENDQELVQLRKGSDQSNVENQNLRSEIRNLMNQIQSLNTKNEDLNYELRDTQEKFGEIEHQVTFYKRKYEATRTELEDVQEQLEQQQKQNAAANNNLTSPSAIADSVGLMPFAPDGAIEDCHVIDFQKAVDDLLTAGRSDKNSSVLPAMKSLVTTVTKIDQDVKMFEHTHIDSMDPSEQERLQSLKINCNQTLSNLMTAARNHATSQGLSPVSLLDAASSHLVVTVVDMIKMLHVRQTTKSTSSPTSSSFNVVSRHAQARSQSNSNSIDDRRSPIGGHRSESSASKHRPSPLPRSDSDRLHPTHMPGERSIDSQSGMNLPRTTSPTAYENNSPASAYQRRPSPTPLKTNGLSNSRSNSNVSPIMPRKGSSPLNAHHPKNDGNGLGVSGSGSMSSINMQRNGSFGSSSRGGDFSDHNEFGYKSGGNQYSARDRDSYDKLSYEQSSYSKKQPQNQQRYDRSNLSISSIEQERFDTSNNQNGTLDDHGSEDWDELKAYLESQTEAIVQSIQTLLTSIRSGAQGPEINENLTQITNIVTSIIDICRDSGSFIDQINGHNILADLAENCDRLTDLQAKEGAGFTKSSKQTIASASFGVAKSLKALKTLISDEDQLT